MIDITGIRNVAQAMVIIVMLLVVISTLASIGNLVTVQVNNAARQVNDNVTTINLLESNIPTLVSSGSMLTIAALVAAAALILGLILGLTQKVQQTGL